jgi:TolB-like protein/Tfp pilus assembly protein PilF
MVASVEPTVTEQSPSIAVMPLTDLSPSKDQEYFCDGLAESIITNLARIPGLRVVSRNSAFHFKNVAYEVSEIKRKLNVTNLLAGSVQKSGKQLRISLQLINTSDGFLQWAEDFRKDMDDIFQIQDDITEAVINSLKPKLSGKTDSDIYKHSTHDIDAYNAFLKGRFHLNQRTVSGLNKSIEYFTEAVDLDPSFALAYAGLSDTYTILGIYGTFAPHTIMPRAIEMAHQALSIDEGLSEAHISLGCVKAVYEWNWQASEQAFSRGLALNENYAVAHHWYAINYLVPLRRFQEAKREIQKALSLDPVSLIINVTQGLIDYFSSDFPAAIEQYRRVVQMQPEFAMSNFFLGEALVQEGMLDEGMYYIKLALDLFGNSTNMLSTYAYAAALSDNRDIAETTLQQLLKSSTQQYVSAYDIACIYLGLDDKVKALDWLEKAREEHAFLLIYLNVDPKMEPLRSHPRFKSIINGIFT